MKSNDLLSTRLYDQQKFYDAFTADLSRARSMVIIESPFITTKRMERLLPTINKLRQRGVRMYVNTKPPEELESPLYEQSVQAITTLQELGVKVMLTVGHHRKIAIIDDILWEGSLNILSQNDSCELMRRANSQLLVEEMLGFIGARKWAY